MKLELKHLAPYLPYDLKIFIPNGKGTGTLDCLSSAGVISAFAFGIKERMGLHNPVQWSIKPLLIPMTEENITEDDLKATGCGSRLRLRNLLWVNGAYHFQFEYNGIKAL